MHVPSTHTLPAGQSAVVVQSSPEPPPQSQAAINTQTKKENEVEDRRIPSFYL